jgi:hypothetical protein
MQADTKRAADMSEWCHGMFAATTAESRFGQGLDRKARKLTVRQPYRRMFCLTPVAGRRLGSPVSSETTLAGDTHPKPSTGQGQIVRSSAQASPRARATKLVAPAMC